MKSITILSTIIVFVFASCSNPAEEKYFSGTVGYAYSYSSDSLSADSISKLRPASSTFRYDTTGYQSRFMGPDTVTYYYSGRMNKCVAETGMPAKYECEDYAVANDSVLSFKLYETTEKVLGYDCKILEMQKKNSWVKYYVSTGHIIAPATYRDHKAYNWDFYGKNAGGGLILKMEHRFKFFTLHGVATQVQPEANGFIALEMNEQAMAKICSKE